MRKWLLIALAVAAVPFSWEVGPNRSGSGSNCRVTESSGIAPWPFALSANRDDTEPGFSYTERGSNRGCATASSRLAGP